MSDETDGIPVDEGRLPFAIARAAAEAGVDLDELPPPYLIERVDDDMHVTQTDSGRLVVRFPIWWVRDVDSELVRRAVMASLGSLEVGHADQFATAINQGLAHVDRPWDEDWIEVKVTVPQRDEDRTSLVLHRSLVVPGWPPGVE